MVYPKKFSFVPIHLVDKADTGDIVALHLTIDSNGLGLNSTDSAQDQDGTIQHTQSSLDLDGEIDVPYIHPKRQRTSVLVSMIQYVENPPYVLWVKNQLPASFLQGVALCILPGVSMMLKLYPFQAA